MGTSRGADAPGPSAGATGSTGRVRNAALRAVGVVALGAATLGFVFYGAYNATVYWNLDNDHRWYYIHPALYGATAALGILAIVAGARGVKSPARVLWLLMPWALAVLVLLTLGACAFTTLARAYPV